MKSEWKNIKISELGKIITGKTPKTSIKDNYGGKILFLTPSDDMTVKKIYNTSKKITEKGMLSVKNCLLPKNSICVSCIGSDLGKVVLTTEETVTNQQINSIIVDSIKYDFDFVYYAMLILGRKLNYDSKTSTAVPIINKSTFSSYTILCPNLEIQRKIASILSALDEKIELNQRINKNLEQQAQAIFDEMFPNIVNDVTNIGNYITPKRGKGLLAKDAVFGNVPVVAGGLNPSTYHNVSNTKAPVITISASGANSGYIGLWHIPVWSSDSSFIDIQMTDNVYFWYVLLKKRQQEIYDSQTGSAQPHIYPQHIASMPLAKLNETKVNKYTNTVTPFFKIIGCNIEENKKLSNLRDTLLPKLMSGELDVSEIEL